MRPDPRKYLWDALRAAERLGKFRQGKSFAGYQSDDLLRSAVERQLEIIGEALTQLPCAVLTTCVAARPPGRACRWLARSGPVLAMVQRVP